MRLAHILGIILLFPVCGMSGQAASQLQKPLSKVELLALRLAGERQDRIELDMAKRGIDFQPTEDYLNALRAAGARDALIGAVRKASASAVPATVGLPSPGPGAGPVSAAPEAAARDSQVLQHLLQAAKLLQGRAWPEAEQEIRSALAIEPDNALLHVDLSAVLPSSQGEFGWDAAIAEDREALRLQPDLALAHFHIGTALRQEGHTKDAIVEDREVVRLDPDDPHAWNHLARVLEEVGDLDSAMAAYKEALARKPDDAFFHRELAELLEKKGDLDGAITQAREAVRIAPERVGGHFVLAEILRSKGDKAEAAKEMRIATTLQAKNPPRRIRVGGVVMSKELIYQPRLTYPREAKKAGIQGTVRLEVVIARDGKVQEMKLLSGHPTLAKAAMKVVSKWRYQRSLLSGEPVEVVTEVDMHFPLAKGKAH
jgi:TonB family protein